MVAGMGKGNSNSNYYDPIWHRSQCFEVKWGARVLRVRSVSREEVWASAGVQSAWVVGCGCVTVYCGVLT